MIAASRVDDQARVAILAMRIDDSNVAILAMRLGDLNVVIA